MSVRKLVQLRREDFHNRESSLRQPCSPVQKFDTDLELAIRDLVDTFDEHGIAIGLAAPQIGIQLQICVVNIAKGKPKPHLLLINPQIITCGSQLDERFESCMSIPLFRGLVVRPTSVRVSYLDEHNNEREVDAEGFLARVIQHEIDHLSGILYVDRMKDISLLQAAEFPKFED